MIWLLSWLTDIASVVLCVFVWSKVRRILKYVKVLLLLDYGAVFFNPFGETIFIDITAGGRHYDTNCVYW